MTQIAEVVGVHETTVSRAIANKYIKTPHGVFDFKYFFTPGYQADSGAAVSNTSVKEMINDLIMLEDKAHPLSDQEIVTKLQEKASTSPAAPSPSTARNSACCPATSAASMGEPPSPRLRRAVAVVSNYFLALDPWSLVLGAFTRRQRHAWFNLQFHAARIRASRVGPRGKGDHAGIVARVLRRGGQQRHAAFARQPAQRHPQQLVVGHAARKTEGCDSRDPPLELDEWAESVE